MVNCQFIKPIVGSENNSLPRYAYTPEAVRPYLEYARKIYANYLLDRPRRTSQSDWPKKGGPEPFDQHVWPYQFAGILGAEENELTCGSIAVVLTAPESPATKYRKRARRSGGFRFWLLPTWSRRNCFRPY
jgi:hypothetical protein